MIRRYSSLIFVTLLALVMGACNVDDADHALRPAAAHASETERSSDNTMTQPPTLSLIHRVEEPRQPSKSPPVLVLLHGYGSHEGDLLPFARTLDPRLKLVAVRGPVSVGPRRHAWYPLDWSSGRPKANTADMRHARGDLETFLRDVPRALGVNPERVFVLGFSQGAIMGLDMAALGIPLAGVMALSGRMPLSLEENPLDECRLPPIFVAHGSADKVIPVHKARALRDALRTCGERVQYHEVTGGGHGIAPTTRAALAQWLTARLDAGSSKR